MAEPAGSTHSLAPLGRAILMFLGCEIVPRLVDTLIAGLERRLTQPTTTSFARLPAASPICASQGKGKGHRARNRRGLNDQRNRKGRR
jgi:hypothetical protein